MTTNKSLTEMLMQGNETTVAIAQIFAMDVATVKSIKTQLHEYLHDMAVSEEEFQEWCDQVDQDLCVYN